MRSWLVSGLVALGLCAATPARAEPPIWRVSDADTEMVLFGSVHALPEGIEWRSAALEAAFRKAELVAFEILTPETEEEEFAQFAPLMEYMFSDRPISEVLTAKTLARLQAAGAKQDFPAEGLERLRPWAAAMILSMGADEALGRTEELGVDMVLENDLSPNQRKVALDTDALLLGTMQALAEFGDSEGEALLIEVLDMLEEDNPTLDISLESAWVAGNLGPLTADVAEMKAEAPRLYQALMIDRNRGWMPALKGMMDTEGRVLVIAGAAHMVGPDGLPTLLRQAGYKVEGP